MAKKNKYYRPQKYVILGVTPDEYEFPMKMYSSIKEMCEDLQMDIRKAYYYIHYQTRYKKTNLKYIKVDLKRKDL